MFCHQYVCADPNDKKPGNASVICSPLTRTYMQKNDTTLSSDVALTIRSRLWVILYILVYFYTLRGPGQLASAARIMHHGKMQPPRVQDHTELKKQNASRTLGNAMVQLKHKYTHAINPVTLNERTRR